MPVTVRKSKKRKPIKMDAEHKANRLAYRKKMKNPTERKKVQKKAKLWRKRNKVALTRKAKLN
jgi:hypothetical protein